jgi:hypothetical protein
LYEYRKLDPVGGALPDSGISNLGTNSGISNSGTNSGNGANNFANNSLGGPTNPIIIPDGPVTLEPNILSPAEAYILARLKKPPPITS